MTNKAHHQPGDIIDFESSVRYMPGHKASVPDASMQVADWASASALEHQTVPSDFVPADGAITTPASLLIREAASSEVDNR